MTPEGLSASEVGRELAEHAEHAKEHGEPERDMSLLSIAEAVLLSVVALVAAWSGYSAAKWSTETRLKLAKSSTARSGANRAFSQGVVTRSQDAADFDAWFAAYLAGNKNGERVAEKRFRTGYDVAFRAWLATHPFTNPNAPKGPQYMPQYKRPGQALSQTLDRKAEELYAQGQDAGTAGDKYIRATVILASVLFLVGISSHFPMRGGRLGLIGVGAALLIFAAVQILQLPGPPA